MTETIKLSEQKSEEVESKREETKTKRIFDWEEIARRNLANQARIKREKAQQNEKVLKRYRIK